MKKRLIIVISLIVILIIGTIYHFNSSSKKKNQWLTEDVTKGNIVSSVSASGSLAALKTVVVGSQVSGNILKLYADFNDRVKAGQTVAEIEPSTFLAHVKQATANLENAHSSAKNILAQIKNLEASLLTSAAEIKVSIANKTKARVNVEDAQRNFKRISALYKKKLVSAADRDSAQTSLDLAKAGLESAVAQIEASKARRNAIYAQIDAMKAQHEGALARVKQMEAQLSVAQINLDRTKIISPVDGVVISREVDVGQTVAASLQAPKLFTIAQDLGKMQIDTAVDEADIGQVKEGQKVTFTVDAYKNRTFRGVVEQVRLLPVETSNVVTYSVMVNVQNDKLLLKPGMTANVEIVVGSKKDALRIPVKAMYFKFPGQKKQSKEILDRAADILPVWILKGKKPVKKLVEIGISNEKYIEVLSDELTVKDKIIVGQTEASNGGKDKKRGSMRVKVR